MAENNNENSLILIQNNLISRVDNSIQITNKILNRNISELFNTAFCKMNSKKIAEVNKDYLFLFESSSSFRKNELFQYKANTNDDYYIALDLFSKILKINPNHLLTKDMAAICKIELKQLDEAIEDYNKIIQNNPNYIYAYLNKAKALDVKMEGTILLDKSEIIENLNCAISIDSKFAEAYRQKALVYFGDNELDDALLNYSKAIEVNPNYASAYYGRALVKISKIHNNDSFPGYLTDQLSNFNDALTDLNKSIVLDSTNAGAFYRRGKIKIKLKDHEGARLDFVEINKINPDYISSILQLAKIKITYKKYDEALEGYNMALLINSKSSLAYFGRGNVKFAINDFRGAIVDFTQAIEIDTSNFDYYLNRSKAYEKLGVSEKAANDMLIYDKLKNK